jgi:hypothetical protein
VYQIFGMGNPQIKIKTRELLLKRHLNMSAQKLLAVVAPEWSQECRVQQVKANIRSHSFTTPEIPPKTDVVVCCQPWLYIFGLPVK